MTHDCRKLYGNALRLFYLVHKHLEELVNEQVAEANPGIFLCSN